MRWTPPLRPSFLLGALVALLAGGPALGYVIYLRDGTRLIAREKPTARGKDYVFLSQSGNRQMIPVAEVDEARTRAHNEGGFGDSYVMTETPGQRAPEAPSKGQSLSDVIRNRKITIRDSNVPGRAAQDDIAPVKPTPAPAPGLARSAPRQGTSGSGRGAQAAGSALAQAGPAVDTQISDAFTRALETSGIRGARLVPNGPGLRVQALTDSEQQVFAALGAVARGIKESRALGKPMERTEIVLATSTGQAAGRFNMSADDADALLNGKISAANWFVANVVF